MEQHPVPRNISSFEFHLIGDMTLRQFGYLAGGGFIAYLLYRVSPFPQIVTIPLAASIGLCGVAFAFFPIQERPLDKWLVAFIRSIFAPTQYLWQKQYQVPDILLQASVVRVQVTNPVHLTQHNEAKIKLEAYLKTIPAKPHETLNAAEKKYLESTLALFGPAQNDMSTLSHPMGLSQPHIIPHQSIRPPVRAQTPPPKVSSLILKDQFPPNPIPVIRMVKTIPTGPVEPKPVTPPIVQPQPISPSIPTQKQDDGEEKWGKLAKEKQALEMELQRLHEELAKLKRPEVLKPGHRESVKEPTIQTISQSLDAKKMGVPSYPQYPNMVVGIVQDTQKRFLPNIIVTVKDKNATPLRALKTNKLGQFATATQLPNGTYHLELEDPMKRYVFDIAEITLSGTIFPPLDILAKGEKELVREKLTKEIFGSAGI